jgi:hypothetical protein
MDIVDLTSQILLQDCGVPVIEERRSSETDLGCDVRFLPARIAVAAWWLLLDVRARKENVDGSGKKVVIRVGRGDSARWEGKCVTASINLRSAP